MEDKIEVTDHIIYKVDKSEHRIRIAAESNNIAFGRSICIINSRSFVGAAYIPIEEWAKVKDAVDRSILRLEQLEGR